MEINSGNINKQHSFDNNYVVGKNMYLITNEIKVQSVIMEIVNKPILL